MIQLAPLSLCTGCGACAYPCPKECIDMQEDTVGQLYPIIDHDNCIECGACQRICPILNEPAGNAPQKVYAAWSRHHDIRSTSASGGIAHEIYNYAIDQGYYVVGASTNSDFTVSLKITNKKEVVEKFKNSKYVFSSGYSVFKDIRTCIKEGNKIVVVGVPCQIAAMKKMFRKQDDIVFIEILCHGMTPHSYLQQHIQQIELETRQKAHSVNFRDPHFKTQTYTFTLKNKERDCFYAKRTKDGDSYQYGYHRAVSYRENCYHCKFAKKERMGDIVLSDFYGLGKIYPCEYSHEKVSSVIVCTEKGKRFFDTLAKSGHLFAEERLVEEAVEGNPRLICTNPKTESRIEFEKRIAETNGNFEKAIRPLLEQYMKTENAISYKRVVLQIINKIKSIFTK